MISIVVPVYNEEESLEALFAELLQVLPTLSKEYEIIFVDDGSTDASLPILKSFVKKNSAVRVFSFRRNMGKAEALTCGFQKAKGEYIITLDADLQDQPSEIYKLLAKAKEGTDVVCGWRKDRRDASKMKMISKFFNQIMDRVFGLHIHDYNCGLKVFSRDVAKSLRLYGSLHRFIPILAVEQGFSVEEVAVHHEKRKFGTSKYSFSKVWKDIPDLFTIFFLIKYSKRPMHFFGIIGGVLFLLGLGIFCYLSIIWFLGAAIRGRPLFFTSILLILGGLQIFFTGFLADLFISLSQTGKSNRNPFLLKYATDKEPQR
jgi:glycosyltransferase involved in cell wall biosynthesis